MKLRDYVDRYCISLHAAVECGRQRALASQYYCRNTRNWGDWRLIAVMAVLPVCYQGRENLQRKITPSQAVEKNLVFFFFFFPLSSLPCNCAIGPIDHPWLPVLHSKLCRSHRMTRRFSLFSPQAVRSSSLTCPENPRYQNATARKLQDMQLRSLICHQL